jgi:hypothetical protein
MNAIRIRKRIDSETLHLPELRPLIGKTVDIIVREDTTTAPGKSPYDAFFALVGQDVVDPEAYKRLLAASMI